MFKENPFDPVFDCQQVFKTLMNALARPGTIVSTVSYTHLTLPTTPYV